MGAEEIRENKAIVSNLMMTNLKSAFESSEDIFHNHRKWTTWQNMAEKYLDRVENLKNQTVSSIAIISLLLYAERSERLSRFGNITKSSYESSYRTKVR